VRGLALTQPTGYGKGGEQPTVTDANLVLGRLRPEAFLGGHMEISIFRQASDVPDKVPR